MTAVVVMLALSSFLTARDDRIDMDEDDGGGGGRPQP
jgi:hypothetical protein